MKFTKLFKKNICHAILLGLTSPICSTLALAVDRPAIVNWKSPAEHSLIKEESSLYMPTREGGIDALIVELVQKAASLDANTHTPSAGLIRCYDRIMQGYQTIAIADVMEAMPELLWYAVAKYEMALAQSTSSKSSIADTVSRAIRPENPYAPGAIVGSILADPYAASCAQVDCQYTDELCDILELIRIIKKRIGTVHDDVCANSVLGVLGDACEILGMSISEAIKELLESSSINCCAEVIATITTCCDSLHEDIDELIIDVTEISSEIRNIQCRIDCKLGEFNDCYNCDACPSSTHECTQCCMVFDNVSDGLSEIYCTVNEIIDSVEIDFDITWSLIDNISTGTNCCTQTTSLILEILSTLTQCCDDLADDIFDTLTILSADIDDLKETLSVCCDQRANDIFDTQTLIIECCELTQSNFAFTWSLIEACCEQTQTNFEITWSLIEECCQLTSSNFETTWSLIENLENNINECCDQTQNDFAVTWSIIENLAFTTTIDFTEVLTAIAQCCQSTESAITACCEQTQNGFEITWSLIENIDVTCSITANLTPVIDAIDTIEATLTACCNQTRNDFATTWSLINEIQDELIACCETTQSTLNTLSLTCSLVVDFEPVLDEITQIESTLTTCCAQNQTDFETTWSLINAAFDDISTEINLSTSIIIQALLTDTGCPCQPTPLSQADVIGGSITLTTSGMTYCMSENIVGNLVISASSITIDMNNKQLNGLVTVNDSMQNIVIKNGSVLSPAALTESAASIRLATTINGRVSHIELRNLTVSSDPTIEPLNKARDGITCQGSYLVIDNCTVIGERAPSNIALPGGRALDINGQYVEITNNTLISGDGSSSTGIVGSNSGSVIVMQGSGTPNNFYRIMHNTLLSGTPGSATFGAGGGEVALSLFLLSNGIIAHNKIVTSDTALPLSTATNATRPSGTGILVSLSNNLIITENNILTGQAINSNSAFSTNSGYGILISNVNTSILVSKNIIRTGAGITNTTTTISGRGADSGDGIRVDLAGQGQNIQITHNTITTGNAASGSTGTGNNGIGGNAGNGIAVLTGNNRLDVEIRNNTITRTGNGGNPGSGGTAVGGNGGHGILVQNGTRDVEVRLNTLSNTGIGGTNGGLAGRAINDLKVCPGNATAGGFTVAYSNFAYAIADTTIRYLLHGITAEAGTPVSAATNALDNVYVDSCSATPVNLANCCEEIQATLTTDFALTQSLLSSLGCDLTEVLTTLSSNFNTTTSLIDGIENEVLSCCITTQSILENIQTSINACGSPTPVSAPVTISVPGYYCLTNNINGQINITSNNVILNLNGYTVSNPGSVALNTVLGTSNLTVFGGTVATSTLGALFLNATNIYFVDVDFDGCSNGISVGTNFGNFSKNIQLLNCNFYQGQRAIDFLNTQIGILRGCTFYNNNIGASGANLISMSGSSDIVIEDCILANNTFTGNFGVTVLSVNSTSNFKLLNTQLCNNTCTGTNGSISGLTLSSSANAFVSSCEFNTNVSALSNAYGLTLSNFSSATISDCTAIGNTNTSGSVGIVSAGYNITNCNQCSITNNTLNNHISNSGSSGMIVSGCTQTSIINNTLLGNNVGITKDTSPLFVLKNFAFGTSQANNYVSGSPLPISSFNTTTRVFTPNANPISFVNISAV